MYKRQPLTGSLYELLAEKKGIVCDRSLRTVITVTTANGEHVKLLQVPVGAPLFVMDGIMAVSYTHLDVYKRQSPYIRSSQRAYS